MYIVGKPMTETIYNKFSGSVVEGRIIGFRGKGTSTAVLEQNYGKKYKARRPVYRYPATMGSLDSLDGFSSSGILLPWLNFNLNDKVTVVFPENEPQKSHIYSIGIFFSDLVLLLLCLYMVKLGIS